MNKTASTSSKKVVVNSVVYTVSGLLLKCVSFFLLPLYTVYLTTEDYGLTSLASSFVSTFSFVIAFSLFSAILRFYVDLKDDREKLKRFYGTIFIFIFISGIIFFGIFTLLKNPISQFFFEGTEYYPIIFVCLLTLIFNCQHTAYVNVLKSQQKALKSSIVSIVSFLVNVALNITFVVGFNMGALGVLLATLISDVGFFLFAIIDMVCQRMIKICFDFKLLKSALKYSLPIMPHNLSTQIALLVSKILIGDGSLGVLGVYAVASQFGNIADMVQSYVGSAYGPWLYEKLKSANNGYKKDIRRISGLLIAVIGLFFVGLSLFSQDYIVLFVNRDYVEAWKLVPLIVSVFAIKTAYYFYVEILFYNKSASKLLFTATLSSSIVNVLLSAVLIPCMGVYGSILADALSMLIRVIIIIIISKKFENIGLRISDFIINLVIVVGFIFGGLALSYFIFNNVFSFYNLFYKFAIVGVYVILMLLRYKKDIKAFIMIRRERKNDKKSVN